MIIKKSSPITTLLFFEYTTISLTGFCLLFFGIISGMYKIHVLSGTALVAVLPVSLRLYKNTWNWYALGFRFDNLREALPLYFKAAVAGGVVLLLYGLVFPMQHSIDWDTFIQYSVLGAIAQELLYRAYLMLLGQQLFGDGVVNLSINVAVFVGMHAFYEGFLQKLIVLIPAGILFTLLYKKYPNIFLVTCVHIFLNALAIYLGVFSNGK